MRLTLWTSYSPFGMLENSVLWFVNKLESATGNGKDDMVVKIVFDTQTFILINDTGPLLQTVNEEHAHT